MAKNRIIFRRTAWWFGIAPEPQQREIRQAQCGEQFERSARYMNPQNITQPKRRPALRGVTLVASRMRENNGIAQRRPRSAGDQHTFSDEQR